MTGEISRAIINLSIVVVLIAWSVYWSIDPATILYNTYFSPCANNFPFDYNSKTCRCQFPFTGQLCENHECANGEPTRTTNGFECTCKDRWFGKYCTLCGTHDSRADSCIGNLPWPNSDLCSIVEHNLFGVSTPDQDFHYLFNDYKFDGEVEFYGNNCEKICLKVENARSLQKDALALYNALKESTLDVIACPDALCYGCSDQDDALCVDGAVKSFRSRECNLICEPCDFNICKPCNHRGDCILRGDIPVCQCQQYARGGTCEKICPGITEVYNGITTTLIGPECYGHGQCDDNAVCLCQEDSNSNSMFIENCKYECPKSENGLVCNGHGTCQMDASGSKAICVCEDSWFNPKCSCSDGTANDAKTCIQGECNVDSIGCTCYDDEVRGHWQGEFCNLCQQHWFSESNFCLQYCNPETTCEGNSNRCVVDINDNIDDITEPCSVIENQGILEYQGVCARCECLGTFNDTLTLHPLTINKIENNSLAYQCGSCKDDFYPKTNVVNADPDVAKCSIECNYEICNERGACMLDSGDCTCYGSCATDSTKYSGECLMKPNSTNEYTTIQPRFNANDRCSTCLENFQPNITGGVYWNSSCIYFCNHLFTEESVFPDICKLPDQSIRPECVFCSGKADGCIQTGVPTCNCLDGFSGTYCQSTCNAAGGTSCTNGECKVNELANWFDLKTLPYNKKSTFECKCNPQDPYTTEERNEYEEILYVANRYDVDLSSIIDLADVEIVERPDLFGTQCDSSCKVDLEEQICSSRGNCVSFPIVGLSNLEYCNADSECNVLPGTAFEDRERFCHFEKIPKYWQYVNLLQNSVLSSCTESEVSWIKKFIDNYDWDRFCYNYVSTAIPLQLNDVKCSTCSQLTENKNLWNDVEAKCSQLIQFSNLETLESLSSSCSSRCRLSIRNFNWKSYCSQPKEVFEAICPNECIDNFKKIDFVTSSGFCGTQKQYTTNQILQTNACSFFRESDKKDTCELVSPSESSTEYEETSACFVPKTFLTSRVTGNVVNQPYSGTDNQLICHSVDDLKPEICGIKQFNIPFTHRSCNNNLQNVRNTGMNDCRLKDAEHLYCSTLFPSGWSTFTNNTEYIVLVNDHPDGIVYATESQLSIKVNNVTSVTNTELKGSSIVYYELFGIRYIGTLVGECILEGPTCFSCGNDNNMKSNVGAVLNTVLESASNYNPNPKKCCNSNSRYQESINEDRFWCYEAENGYGIDFCAYEKCTTTIKNIDWRTKINNIRQTLSLNVDGIITGLQEPAIRDSFSIHQYCTDRQNIDLQVSTTTDFDTYGNYCLQISANKASDIYYFSGNALLPSIISVEALVADKLAWWGSLYDSELDLINVRVQDLIIPTNTDVVTIDSTKLVKSFSSNNVNNQRISVWVFIPYDKYRYILDLELKNAAGNVLCKLEVRRHQFYFNFQNTAFEITESSLVSGYWFHLEFSFTASKVNLKLSGSGRVQTIDDENSLSDTTVTTLTVRQPETLSSNSVQLHDLRVAEDIKKSYLYDIFGTADLDYGHCSDYLTTPVGISEKICQEEYDNVTVCEQVLAEEVNWPTICSTLTNLYTLDTDTKTEICNTNQDCLNEVNNFLNNDIVTWVDEFIATSVAPLGIKNATECVSSSLACRQALQSFDYEDFCDNGLNDVYDNCDDCSSEFDLWRASFEKETFCTDLDNAEQEIENVLKTGISSCSLSCKDLTEDIDYINFCSNRLAVHDIFAPHALSYNLSSYCKEQIYVSLPLLLSETEHKLDYVDDCTSLGTLGSVNLYTENNVQKSGQCRKLTCECTEVGVGGDRCNIDCPISSFDDTACNSGTGLGQCCLDPIDGSRLTAENCETDILTSSSSFATTVGSCICYNSGTDSVIAGYNCEEQCKKCNLEYGQCSVSTGTCMCVNNAFRTTIKSQILNFEKEFSDLKIASTSYSIDTKTFDNVVYAKKYCQSLGNCVGIINKIERIEVARQPDLSLTESECKEYNDFIGSTGWWVAEYPHTNNNPPGCQEWTSNSDPGIKYNPVLNTLDCRSDARPWLLGCIEKENLFRAIINTVTNTVTVGFISDYDTPQIKEIDEETELKTPIIFDWANKETVEGTANGDQTVQVNAILLYSPDDPCTTEMNSLSIVPEQEMSFRLLCFTLLGPTAAGPLRRQT